MTASQDKTFHPLKSSDQIRFTKQSLLEGIAGALVPPITGVPERCGVVLRYKIPTWKLKLKAVSLRTIYMSLILKLLHLFGYIGAYCLLSSASSISILV